MSQQTFNPQLRFARFLPRTVITSRTLPVLRFLTKLAGIAQRPDGQVVSVDADVSYPMLDDRTTTAPTSTRGGCACGASAATGSAGAPTSAPPRRTAACLRWPRRPATKTFPAWIGVGTNDLFHDEDVTYARRLQQAGVACALHVVPGAYHAFDSVEAKAAVAQAFFQAQTTALDEALNGR